MIYTIFFLIFSAIINAQEKAVICVPIADLLGQPIHATYPEQSVDDFYKNIPVCYKINFNRACNRVHQLLYNDIVDVIEIKNDEAHIKISQFFYTTPSLPQPQTTYWTAAKNLRLLSDLTHHKIKIDHIPQPINFNLPDKIHPLTITLVAPHYDSQTQLTFSAGTRFLYAQKPKKSHTMVKVFTIHHPKNKEITISIPMHKCYIHTTQTPQEQIKRYVLLLKQWAHQPDSFIPYVWGGTSFCTSLNVPFKDVTKEISGDTYSFFEFENNCTYPKNGFDCSGLIARAAQICNMPYFYKNTTTIGHNLQPLTPEDSLMNGDLILIKGHVMVISDIDQNLLIEARSYGHGYGKVHEIELHKVFDGIMTYNDLREAFFNKKELKRKDIWGKAHDTFTDWKILKIMSVYKNL